MLEKESNSCDGKQMVARGGATLLFTSLLLVAGGSTHEALARVATTPVVAPDTVPLPSPRLFHRRILFSPEYLRRALEDANTRKLAESDDGQATAYARRYGIRQELAKTILVSAKAEGIDPELAFRLVRVESVFQTNARSPGGALGLTQLMPSTARSLDRSLRTDAQILEPTTNLRTGFRYLRDLITRYDGDVRLGILAYNRGETAVDRAIRAGRDPENGYSPKVLGSAANRYTGPGLIDGLDVE